ncbi:MAG TPA: N-formylglutamate amidohydrolase [Geminicoccaceae bacterium]|nr:N-formylglutamate amidohydrolase [Geminicoccaceae bacterium]
MDALDDIASWIAADEPPAFELVNADGRSRALLTCDHANPRIPRRLGDLGLAAADRLRHVAWDIGTATLARRLASILDAPLVLSGYSRLVVDCNRPLEVASAFCTRSEDVDVPGNLALSEAEKAARAAAFYWPYQDAVHELVESRMGRDVLPVMISIHSFTPVFLGRARPWHIGVHYRLDRRLAALALAGLRADPTLTVGENEPYPVALDEDYTIPVHAELRGLPYVLFEIRQDLLGAEPGIDAWAERLGGLLAKALSDPSLDHLAPPATDLRAPRYQKGP